MSPRPDDFGRNIFINCPFDEEYKPLLRVLLFTVISCGLEPRIASERLDSGEVRIDKIKSLIRKSLFSIHDISRMESKKEGEYARFNLPFELGLDLVCKEYGSHRLLKKRCLILDKEPYRYQKVISDISGNDIRFHKSDPETLIRQVRNWISGISDYQLPGGAKIWLYYNEFYSLFEISVKDVGYDDRDIDEMPIYDFISFIKNLKKDQY